MPCSEAMAFFFLKGFSLILFRLKDKASCSEAKSTPADLLTRWVKRPWAHPALRRAAGVSEPPGLRHHNGACSEVGLGVRMMVCIRSLRLRLMGQEPGKLCSSQTSAFSESHCLHKGPQRSL